MPVPQETDHKRKNSANNPKGPEKLVQQEDKPFWQKNLHPESESTVQTNGAIKPFAYCDFQGFSKEITLFGGKCSNREKVLQPLALGNQVTNLEVNLVITVECNNRDFLLRKVFGLLFRKGAGIYFDQQINR